MATVDREIYDIQDTLAGLLASLQEGQRGVVTDTTEAGAQMHVLDGEFYLTANSKKYDGVSWVDLDASFAEVTTTGLKDSFVTSAIPIGESGQATLDGGFTATSIVGALNELIGLSGDTEWDRVVVNPTTDYVKPILVSGVTTYVHTVDGLTDSDALIPIKVGDASNTSLDAGFGASADSLYGALNYLFNNSVGTDPAGSDTEVQYNDGGVFGASERFTFDAGALMVWAGGTDDDFCLMTTGDDSATIKVGDGISDVSLYSALNTLQLRFNSAFDAEIVNVGGGSVLLNGVELLYGGNANFFLNAAGVYVDLTTSPYYPDILYYNVVSPESHTARITADDEEITLEKMLNFNAFTNGTWNDHEAISIENFMIGYSSFDELDEHHLYIENRVSTDLDNTHMSIGSQRGTTDYIATLNLSAQEIYIENATGYYNLFDYVTQEIFRDPLLLSLDYRTSTGAPGSGEITFDTALSTSKVMKVSNFDSDNQGIQVLLEYLTPGSVIYLFDSLDRTKWVKYLVNGFIQQTGYTELSVRYITNNGSASFVDGYVVHLHPQNSVPLPLNVYPMKFSTTTSTPPSSGQIRFNNATQASATHIYIHDADSRGTYHEYMNINFKKYDRILLSRMNDNNFFQIWEVSAVSDQTNYTDYTVTLITDSGGSVSFANAEDVKVTWLGANASSISGGGGVASRVYVSMSTSPSVSNGVESTPPFNTETYDSASEFNTSTYEYTAAAAGLVQVNCTLDYTLAAYGYGEVRAYLDTGGGYSRIKPTASASIDNAGSIYPNLGFSLYLSSGHKLQIRGAQFSGYTATNSNTRTFLSIVRMS